MPSPSPAAEGASCPRAARFQVERPIDRFESVTEMLEGLGHVPTSAVLSVGCARADRRRGARPCGWRLDERVIRLVRIRYGDGRPLLYTVDTVPEDCLPGPVRHRDWSGSLTAALAVHGHDIEVSTARLRAVELDHEVAVRHELAGPRPVAARRGDLRVPDGPPGAVRAGLPPRQRHHVQRPATALTQTLRPTRRSIHQPVSQKVLPC